MRSAKHLARWIKALSSTRELSESHCQCRLSDQTLSRRPPRYDQGGAPRPETWTAWTIQRKRQA